jgi:CcmD family protein
MTSVLRIPVLLMLLASVVCSSCADAAAPPQQVAQAQPTQPRQQEEFIPIDQLPPQEQLPAAPLLVGAYAFVLVMLFGYMITVSRRLAAIQREVDRLDSDLKRAGRT